MLEKSGQLERAAALGARVVDLKQLHGPLVQKIDARNSSFWAAKNTVPSVEGPVLGIMERQRLKLWMNHAYGEMVKAGP
jgi:copper oxidase (laccase) domain-containing protein